MNTDPAQNGWNLRQRPEGVSYQEWKNRNKVYSKLTDSNYANFMSWARKKNFNCNSGINYLIATHPEIKKNG